MVSISKQYDAFLRLSARDYKLIDHYRDFLAEGTRGFATYYLDRLRENEASASLLAHYRNDLEGLKTYLGQLEDYFAERIATYSKTGPGAPTHNPFTRDARSVWVVGAYRCYFDYLKSLFRHSNEVASVDRGLLDEALFKVLLNDMRAVLKTLAERTTESARRLHEDIDRNQDRIDSVLANIAQVVWSVETGSERLLYLSPHAADGGIDTDMPIPGRAATLEEDRAALDEAWQNALNGEVTEIESRVHDRDGRLRWVRRTFHPYRDAEGRVARIDGVMEDITPLREAAHRTRQLAHTDTLTGLANRSHWQDRLSHAIQHADRYERQLVVMVTDLNHFKAINYTIGHSIGDDILRVVAHRLIEALPDVDTLARLGGDEFGILLEAAPEQTLVRAETVAQRISDCLAQPIHHTGHEFYLTGSTGIALYPQHGDDANILLSRADIAMYRAKRGDADYQIYHPETDGPTADRLQLSHRLREAISRNELELDFQPKVDVRTRRLCGVEALIRWRNPAYGLVQPDGFIPMAEQMGFITPITEWVITEAFAQYVHWADRGLHLPVAVNVSAQSLNPSLVETIRRHLEDRRIPPSALQIEITENALLEDAHHAESTIAALHGLGIDIAIDDFGTGYSSLNRLKDLPIATLKIDKSFVQPIAASDQDAVIVRSIIDLGHNLGFDIVAEGVEQAEALSVLNSLDCDAVQGFYISRPLSSRQLGNWIINSEWRIDQTAVAAAH